MIWELSSRVICTVRLIRQLQFIVRGFGPAAFQMNARHEDPAVNKVAVGEPVTQELRCQ
jgi:hypothetical protein